MSAAKAITAAVIGTAVQKGLFDIATPIAQYGVQVRAECGCVVLSAADWG